MFDNIIFFNHWNNGDIHVSRNWVNWFIKNIPANRYIYSHKNSKKLLQDIPNLEHAPDLLNRLDKELGAVINDNNLYLNTWYGAENFKHFNGCNYKTLETLFNSYITRLGYNIPNIDFTPDIDFTYFDINNINTFMKTNLTAKKVFISNGNFFSGQSENFDFDIAIKLLALEYPDVIFLLSNDTSVKLQNVITTSSIIKSTDNDLNENAYISTFCDIIIGRNSGPYTFSLIKTNLYNTKKKFIAFVNNKIDINFINNPLANFIWSNNYDNIYNIIKKEL